MPLYRVQISLQDVSGLARDQYVNTLWYTSPTVVDWAQADPDGKGNQVVTAVGFFFGTIKKYLSEAIATQPAHTGQIRIYDHAAPLHSPPVYMNYWNTLDVGLDPAFQHEKALPGEVACCLTFHAEPNPGAGWLPQSWRGRIYIGPLNVRTMSTVAPGTARPNLTFRTDLVNAAKGLGEGLHNIGLTHVIYSRKHATVLPVSYYGVDDAWDVQRSRGLRRSEISRVPVGYTIGGPGPA